MFPDFVDVLGAMEAVSKQARHDDQDDDDELNDDYVEDENHDDAK